MWLPASSADTFNILTPVDPTILSSVKVWAGRGAGEEPPTALSQENLMEPGTGIRKNVSIAVQVSAIVLYGAMSKYLSAITPDISTAREGSKRGEWVGRGILK